MAVIGITGGIASGKSTATTYAHAQGAYVIDADKLGHAAYEPGSEGFTRVVAEFGERVVAEDGTIDRKVLGGVAFRDEQNLKRLTDIVWPVIREKVEDEIREVRGTEPDRLICLEAAVLIEAEWMDLVDELWVIVVDPEVAIQRAMDRDGVERSAIEAKLNAQLSNAERQAVADVVIDNSSDAVSLSLALDKELKRVAATV